MTEGRMEKHVTVLGILYIVFSSLGVSLAILIFWAVVGGGLISGDTEAIAITAIVGSAVSGFLMFVSLPGIVGGIWLLQRKSWARILVLILGFLNLIDIPFGTALGIYTIWVLMNDETIKLFKGDRALQTA
jgi:hypothetical protein